MKEVLLPVFYLPPISWFSLFCNENTTIVFEKYEHFPKQTFRNRANIYGANGKLSLIIPIHHNGKREIKDIEISYTESWQKLHWKSIKTAYQSSPYFEFYEDYLADIYELKEKYLLDFNLKILEILKKILRLDKSYTFTNEYFNPPIQIDFRENFSAKKECTIEIPQYYQTFSDKLGFIKDLSILDLICNKGTESLSYLKKIEIIS